MKGIVLWEDEKVLWTRVQIRLGIFRPINESEKNPLNKSYLRGSSNDPTDDLKYAEGRDVTWVFDPQSSWVSAKVREVGAVIKQHFWRFGVWALRSYTRIFLSG